MRRRNLLGATALTTVTALTPTRLVAATMNTIDVGPWSFQTPSDWRQVETSNGIPYLESRDGTKGCYVKALTFGQAHPSAEEAATFLQGVHERNYLKDSKAKWEAKQRSTSTTGPTARLILDLLDTTSNYRVLSMVLATSHVAIQLTLHDYACKDYSASARVLDPVAASIRGPRGGA